MANVLFSEITPQTFTTHYVQECAPDEYRYIQGEAREVPGGLDFYWTTYPAAMRDALRLGGTQDSPGIGYWRIRSAMDLWSWENLLGLFERYLGHTVEFSVFTRGVGVLGWNTIFWEVRDY
jgi:hypothetical protein